MRVFINLKSVGKRKPAFEKLPYFLQDGVGTLRELLSAVVLDEVKRYNEKKCRAVLTPFLTEAEIDDQSAIGKISFGLIYSEKRADAGKATDAALQGFLDGLFRVMIYDTEAKELDSPLNIKDGDTLTFIRLTFLAGRLW